jgi:lactate dehydrogenase-like 2-hydroxyacid dehydrogenase
MMAEFKVIYMNYATEDVYGIIRSQLPEGFELVTLEKDDDGERKEKIRDVDFILVATAKLAEEILKNGKRLKLIQHQGVGYDTTDVNAAKRMGIPVWCG